MSIHVQYASWIESLHELLTELQMIVNDRLNLDITEKRPNSSVNVVFIRPIIALACNENINLIQNIHSESIWFLFDSFLSPRQSITGDHGPVHISIIYVLRI